MKYFYMFLKWFGKGFFEPDDPTEIEIERYIDNQICLSKIKKGDKTLIKMLGPNTEPPVISHKNFKVLEVRYI